MGFPSQRDTSNLHGVFVVGGLWKEAADTCHRCQYQTWLGTVPQKTSERMGFCSRASLLHLQSGDNFSFQTDWVGKDALSPWRIIPMRALPITEQSVTVPGRTENEAIWPMPYWRGKTSTVRPSSNTGEAWLAGSGNKSDFQRPSGWRMGNSTPCSTSA